MDAEKNVQLDSKPIWNAIFTSYPEIEEVNEDIIIDPEVQADEAINAIEKGIEPTTDWNQNHKAIRKIIQFYVLSVQDTLDDKTLKMFAEYVDELTKWIDADKTVITMEQQEALTDPTANPMIDANGQNIDPNQIENSIAQKFDPIKNQANNIAGQEMGML